jgi:hypothetical protein
MLKRIGQFAVKICKTWGALLTGGFFIAIIASWQVTGHSIPVKVGWALIIGGIVIAAFEVWNQQVNATEKAQHDLEDEKHKRDNPCVLLHFDPIKPLSEEDLEFHLINQGKSDAFNVQIQPIVMPKSTAKFPEVTKVFTGNRKRVKPNIEPVTDSSYRQDFIVMLHNQPEQFLLAHRTADSEGKIDPIVAIPVEITYSNSTGMEWFYTKMEIVFDFDPLKNYIDTRLIETLPLPSQPPQPRSFQITGSSHRR